MATAPHNVPAGAGGAVADAAVRCVACGYDLRGLRPGGKCPECGLDLAISLAARVAPGAAVDPAWRKQVFEGAVLSLLSFALLVCGALIPAGPAPFVHHASGFSPAGFRALAGVCAAAWVVQWYSTLKLVRQHRYERRTALGTGFALIVMTLVSLYTLMPLLILPLPFGGRMIAPDLAESLAAVLGPMCGAAYYVRLAGVFRTLGARSGAAQAWLLALLMPFALAAFRNSVSNDWGPLGLYVTLPSYQHGVPAATAAMLRYLLPPGSFYDLMGHSLPLVVTACGTCLTVRLLFLAGRPRAARAETGDPA